MVELTAGTVIAARYRLERLLGQGGMGVVWAAELVGSHERYAVKLLKDASGDPDARRRFLREARAATAVRHPNVVSIVDVLDPEDASPVLVMELLDGETLRDVLAREGKLGLGALVEIAVPVISAVGAAHALGIVHRDLKPENIFLSRGPDGQRIVKVLDFGIAKLTALDGEAIRSTGVTTGVVLGTPAYMAPEQVYAEHDIDHRADIWALGLILYQCLSGTLATDGVNVGQVLKHVLTKPFAPIEQLVPELPDDITGLIARMLSRERAERPADLREVMAVLAPHASAPAPTFGPPTLPTPAADPHAVPSPTQPAPRDDASQIVPTAPAGEPARRWRWLAVLASAGALALLGLGVTHRMQPPVSPLAAASARLACPVLRASGVEPPAGWLGAAAAAIACERARLILGGRPERTLVPAELLDLPGTPTDDFPADPYGAADARERSVAAARQRAQAYLDGEVVWSAAGFRVALSLDRPDGTSLATGSGEGPGLYEAVRAAMTSLVRNDAIPRAVALEPAIARWTRTDRIDDALGVLDLTFAVAHNAGDLPAECKRFDELSARVHELGFEGQRLCAMTLGQPPRSAALDTSDLSDAAVATRARINHSIHPGDPPGIDPAALFARETTGRGRSLLAAIASCLVESTDSQAALDWALRAVRSDPKNPEGGTCNPWEQLTTLVRDTSGGGATVRAMQAWVPWNSYAWLQPGFRSGAGDPQALRLLRRARVLSPFDANLADLYVESLLASGHPEEVRGVAAELRSAGLLLDTVASELILVRFEASQAKFRAALERARAASAPSPGDAGWVRVQRFEIAWHALELGVLLGRGREVADQLVARFVDPEPPVLESNFTALPMRIAAICTQSSAPAPCFARFRSLRDQLPGAATQDTDDLLSGAEHYVTGDIDGASRAWRPLLAGGLALASAMPDAMVDAFERTGAARLAVRIDDEIMRRASQFHGATLGHVRAARRALAGGDPRTASQLAEAVIDAWEEADEHPPSYAEMRKLHASLSR